MHFNSMFPEFQYIEPGNLLDRFIVNTPFIRRIQIQAMGYFFYQWGSCTRGCCWFGRQCWCIQLRRCWWISFTTASPGSWVWIQSLTLFNCIYHLYCYLCYRSDNIRFVLFLVFIIMMLMMSDRTFWFSGFLAVSVIYITDVSPNTHLFYKMIPSLLFWPLYLFWLCLPLKYDMIVKITWLICDE